MTPKGRTSLAIVLSSVLGAVFGAVVSYFLTVHVYGFFSTLKYDAEVRDLIAHQELLEQLDAGDVESATIRLEWIINGEIFLVDSLVAKDVDGMNAPLRDLIHNTLNHISDYRGRPDYEERVQYAGRDEPGDPQVREILERYRADAP